MAGGWREDGGRMAGGWREDGGRMARGWREDGGRIEGGSREDCGRIVTTTAGYSEMGYNFFLYLSCLWSDLKTVFSSNIFFIFFMVKITDFPHAFVSLYIGFKCKNT